MRSIIAQVPIIRAIQKGSLHVKPTMNTAASKASVETTRASEGNAISIRQHMRRDRESLSDSNIDFCAKQGS